MTAPAKFVQDQNGQHGMTINSLFAGGTIVSGSFIAELGALHQRAGRLLLHPGCRR